MTRKRKNNSIVKQNITDALLKLMKEKPVSDITITELVEEAQVARVSFYRNFNDKEDVLRQEARRSTEAFLEECGRDLFFSDPRAFVVKLFEYLQANRDTVALYDNSNLMEIVREAFDQAFGVGCEDRRESAKRSFVSGGLYNLFRRWIVRDYEPSAERLADFVFDLVKI